MRFVFVLLVAAIAAGCATAPAPRSYASPGVVTQASSPVDVAAYNREIKRQGLAHYCGEGNCDTLPVLVQAYAPVYPAAALAAGIDGHATIVFDVLKDGTLANFKVESASAEPFAIAAIDALRLWRVEPATLDGEPVVISGKQSFPFVAR